MINLNFTGGKIDFGLPPQYCVFSSARMFFTANETLNLFVRGNKGMKIIKNSCWKIVDTIWNWEGQLEDSCYHCDFVYCNNKLYVVGVGKRISNIIDVRDGCYFTYTDDLVTWRSIEGDFIEEPQKIFDGYATDCRLTVENDELLVTLWCRDRFRMINAVELRYYVMLWRGYKWLFYEVPLIENEEYTYCSAWKVDDTVYAYIDCKNQTDKFLIRFTLDLYRKEWHRIDINYEADQDVILITQIFERPNLYYGMLVKDELATICKFTT